MCFKNVGADHSSSNFEQFDSLNNIMGRKYHKDTGFYLFRGREIRVMCVALLRAAASIASKANAPVPIMTTRCIKKCISDGERVAQRAVT
jgi:hypothetical protein